MSARNIAYSIITYRMSIEIKAFTAYYSGLQKPTAYEIMIR
jgi:hypothetical protein